MNKIFQKANQYIRCFLIGITRPRVFLLLGFLLVYTMPLYAYLDPGTGSMLVAVIIGLVSTLLFTLRSVWFKIVLYFKSIFQLNSESKNNLNTPTATTSDLVINPNSSDYTDIVVYSEGKQYWNTFSPIIQSLISKNVLCSYLSSDEEDPGLKIDSPYLSTKFIGTGNKAYAYLNLLQAKICILTTPNLDTLQIRRSKGVQHYTHIIHAPTDIHLYKLFAFDFYDSIMTSGPHQEKSLRHLEQLRNTQQKQIYNVGCPYLDVLLEKKLSHENNASLGTTQSSEQKTLLVAPTWGDSGILKIYGETLLKNLLAKNNKIIVRPHPQSLLVEQDMITYLQNAFKDEANLTWDTNADNFESLNSADVLISDRSGVIFDFAFIFNKPVITHNAPAVLMGMEGNDIPWDAWELEMFPQIGGVFSNAEELNAIVEQVLENPQKYSSKIQELQNKYLYNLGHSGDVATNYLIDILQELCQKVAV